MDLCNSPDIFQKKMSKLLEGLGFVRTHISNLLALTKGAFEDYLEKLKQVLFRLKESGLKVNSQKSFFAKTKSECLGCWIASDCFKPPPPAKAIPALDAPQNQKEPCSFISIINCCRDMWIRHSHVLRWHRWQVSTQTERSGVGDCNSKRPSKWPRKSSLKKWPFLTLISVSLLSCQPLPIGSCRTVNAAVGIDKNEPNSER